MSSLTIQTTAYGGDGGGIAYDGHIGFSGAGNGELASAATSALNASGPVVATAGAVGGRGGASVSGGQCGNGGAAVSDADGSTTGDYSVDVSSSAQGGSGGSGDPFSNRASNAGNGGSALAIASGSNSGLHSVIVTSSAIGGAAYQGFLGGTDGISGDATAMSTAFGLGVVTSTATATGNFSVNGGVIGGAALAHASATGQSGSAAATANTGGGFFTAIQASATAPVGSTCERRIACTHRRGGTHADHGIRASIGRVCDGSVFWAFSHCIRCAGRVVSWERVWHTGNIQFGSRSFD